MNNISGIYQIQSKIKPDKVYIGSAIKINVRWYKHLNYLRRNIHYNSKLQNHFNKYGEGDLQFSVLFPCDKEDLIKKEQCFLDFYNPKFNILPIANSSLGFKHSKKTKQSISAMQTGKKRKPLSEETKKKISVANKGRTFKHTEAAKKKISEAHKGKYMPHKHKPMSFETRKKLSIINKGRVSPKKGIPISDETKKKISVFMQSDKNPHKGMVVTAETRHKLSLSHMGQIAWNKGIPHSEETRRKLKLAWVKRKKRLKNIA